MNKLTNLESVLKSIHKWKNCYPGEIDACFSHTDTAPYNPQNVNASNVANLISSQNKAKCITGIKLGTIDESSGKSAFNECLKAAAADPENHGVYLRMGMREKLANGQSLPIPIFLFDMFFEFESPGEKGGKEVQFFGSHNLEEDYIIEKPKLEDNGAKKRD